MDTAELRRLATALMVSFAASFALVAATIVAVPYGIALAENLANHGIQLATFLYDLFTALMRALGDIHLWDAPGATLLSTPFGFHFEWNAQHTVIPTLWIPEDSPLFDCTTMGNKHC